MNNADFKNIIESIHSEIEKCKNIVIVSHYNPDGDAIGSVLALYLYCRKLNKNVNVIIPNQIPDFLMWMKGSKEIKIYENEAVKSDEIILKSDLFIAVDLNSIERTDEIGKKIKQSKANIILIDHHPNPDSFANFIYSNTHVSSTAELVYEVINSSAFQSNIDKDIASCLYAGIMTDTVQFRHNMSKRTFEILGELFDLDININEINCNIYDSYSNNRMKLLGYVLKKKLKYIKKYNTAYLSLTKKELKKFKHEVGDTDGFVNYPLSIKNVKFSTLFIERENEIKLSFRSKNNFKANEFAIKHFNGGGHKNAAGGRSKENMKNAIKKFVNLLAEYKNELE